ncbi:MAG: haloacid dehalogenase [Armatimonadetes bacterium]|nr:haloacid dehalogenase [Armatimonadota bacterium]
MWKARLDEVARKINNEFEAIDIARDKGLLLHRKVIKQCSLAIRAIHRMEFDSADEHLAEARQLLDEAVTVLKDHPGIYHTGFLQDAMKEYAEARVTYAIVRDEDIPYPEELGVDSASYLKGLAEAVGELRRYILDLIRRGEVDKGERALETMDDIYYMLISMDFPDAITRGLRRTTDVARGCLERTRGDLTNHFDRAKLELGIEFLKSRLAQEDAPEAFARAKR